MGAMSTLVYAELTLASGSSASPLPATRRRSSATARARARWRSCGRAARRRSTRRSASSSARTRSCSFRPGHRSLYTDALVEHPSRPLDDGKERLAAELSADGGGDLAAFTQAAVRALDEQLDDVCLVAVRLSAA
jgi:hypothetical protein